jgi:hypothetical protein
LLDFEECIDVIFEETTSMFRKMPHFVYLEELIILLEGFFQFQTHPCAMYCSLSVSVLAGFLLQGVGTGTAEGKHQLALGTTGQDRMVEISRW